MKKYIAVLLAALLVIGAMPVSAVSGDRYGYLHILTAESGWYDIPDADPDGDAAALLSAADPSIYPCPTRTLYYYGSIVFSGAEDVKWVQSVLCSLGYPLTVDGSYGPATAEAVKQFQAACGLTDDGVTGPATRAKMLELLNGSAPVSNDYHISAAGLSFICGMEGFHSSCYQDGTRSSIGYGTKCTGSAAQPHAAGLHTITREAAMNEMRLQIAADFEPRVKSQTAGLSMTQSQFDALVSLCYNCGGGTSMISNSPLVKYLKGMLTEAQARSEYSRYIVSAGGTVLQPLINRRNAEAELFFSDMPVSYTLDVSGWLDGADRADLSDCGTFDITVGGQTFFGCSDFSRSYPAGTVYFIANIRAAGDCSYLGVHSGALSGTVSGNVAVSLSFRTNQLANDLSGAPEADFRACLRFQSGLYLQEQNDRSAAALPENAELSQVWCFELQSDHYYKITSAQTGYALTAIRADAASGAADLQTEPWIGSDAQLWALHIIGSQLLLSVKSSPLVISENGGSVCLLPEDGPGGNQLLAPEPAPTVPEPENSISGISQRSGIVTVTGYCAESQAQLVCAGYDSEGKLMSVMTETVGAGELNCSLALGTMNAAQVKVYLLDASSRPLCSAQEG